MLTFKKTAVALLTASAIGFLLAPAQAAQTQVNQQNATQSGAAVGVLNSVDQDLTQLGAQGQTDIFNPSAQTQVNQQNAAQNGAAIGVGNGVTQTLEQLIHQYQFD